MRLEHWVYTIPLRLRSLFHRNRLEADLDEELRDHIDRQIDDNLARGMGAGEARLTALRAFGNPVALREQTHNTWSWSGVELLLNDVRLSATTSRARGSPPKWFMPEISRGTCFRCWACGLRLGEISQRTTISRRQIPQCF
jgi:hypothetical protein